MRKISTVPCSIDGCDRPNRKRGWCEMHYKRWRKHGDPTFRRQIRGDDEARFWSHVEKQLDGCWLWNGSTSSGGYGAVRWNRRTTSVHRVSFMLANGPIASAITVDHECHNRDDSCAGGPSCLHRRCVNPAHLQGVSFATNVLRGKGPAGIASRKTHCPSGHPYDEANTLLYRGHRYCRTCQARRNSERATTRAARSVA